MSQADTVDNPPTLGGPFLDHFYSPVSSLIYDYKNDMYDNYKIIRMMFEVFFRRTAHSLFDISSQLLIYTSYYLYIIKEVQHLTQHPI